MNVEGGWKSKRHNRLECKRADEKADELTSLIMKNAEEAVSTGLVNKTNKPAFGPLEEGVKALPHRPDHMHPEQIQNAIRILDEGLRNGYKEFDKANYDEAAVEWSKALMSMSHIKELNMAKIVEEEGEGPSDDEDEDGTDKQEEDKQKELSLSRRLQQELSEYWLRLNANMAMVSLKLRAYREAVSYSDHVLKLDEKNSKAYFRKGSGYIGLRRFDEAIETLETSLLHEPDNAATKALLQEARAKAQQANEKLKKARKKMMDFSVIDSRVPPTQWEKMKHFLLHFDTEAPAWVKKWGWIYAKFGFHCTWSIWLGVFVYYFGMRDSWN
mmetsp:Transcript_83070/g.151967  ORF Transcript_83070/g.151967 Transcript_83070/m.151967 type:complete len:328 (-) Transcript_83070:77-1060(-)